MKFKFKIQKYQTDAVNAITKVFEGQPFVDSRKYTMDMGVITKKEIQQSLFDENTEDEGYGYENANILLSDSDLLGNINNIQSGNNIKQSMKLSRELGRVSLDVEMETGTGKTYVYIKSIFELHKKYGWTKFIIVVPSVAIREGVKKSFEITADHFMDSYGKKARFFIYNSSKLNDLDSFSSSRNIQVMIINSQAFAQSMNEKSNNESSRKIYSKQDSFASRKPIDVIAKNRPILILDEPQKLGGKATQESLKRFNPLFCMNFSATHKVQHNKVYVLDALEAYNQKLVKKIEVIGFSIKNLRGTGKYLYFSNIILSKNKPPMARIEFEINYSKSINREVRVLGVDANLYHLSAGANMPPLEQYKNGYTIKEINQDNNTVTFLNGEVLVAGEAKGDVSEKDIRRIQIRETIQAHFEKEESNFNQGIKTLSLFFIDEVAKYRQYDESGSVVNGEYAEMFEQEYKAVLNEYRIMWDSAYQKYLAKIDVKHTHKGYFSIDKKTNRMADFIKIGSKSSINAKTGLSDDISAYDLILKNKERLLSFDEPTRFIFSHSALREGWDNPNVFQICTLKHSESTVTKRQEVGRGMRLCVNSNGDRMDSTVHGIDVQEINKLTVIASESYESFAKELQKEIKEILADRPMKASREYFTSKVLINENGEQFIIDSPTADKINKYLYKNDYIDDDNNITEEYRSSVANGTLAQLPPTLSSLVGYEDSLHKVVSSVYDESALKEIGQNGKTAKLTYNPINDNFHKKEFQKLWNHINHVYAYKVNFDSAELISNSIKYIDDKLFVSELKYVKTKAEQKDLMEENQLERGESFKNAKTETVTASRAGGSEIKYDIVGKIAQSTTLTRKTVVAILKGIAPHVFANYKRNPEEFMSKVAALINAQKATMIVEDVTYNETDGVFDSDIFTASKHNADVTKIFKAEKHIQDYVITDGLAEKSIERKFAEDLDKANEVCVYAKLPKGFFIPTPVGNYSPDWAIAFNDGYGVKHIFFVAETKGTLESMQLRPIEQAKIKCAKRLFNNLSTSNVKYHDVVDYAQMLDIINNKL